MLPVDLVLVRHGESEGNVAKRRSKRGDESAYTPEHLARHNSKFRLSDKGIEQAKAAGLWVRENLELPFDRYYVSEYIRAKETALHLEIPDALWRPEFFLRERDWGELDNVSYVQAHLNYPDSLAMKEIEPLYWIPPNGESMANLCIRIKWILDTLSRECGDKKVIIVCHGEVMWAFRILIERLTSEEYYRLDNSEDPRERINNCQILHYTRRNPATGEVESEKRKWMRSICPSKPEWSCESWRELSRTLFSNDDLRCLVEANPRLVS